MMADLIAKNADWEGSEELAARLAKTIPPNLLTPSREDMSPQVEAMIQGLQQHIQQMSQQMQMMGKELQDRQADRNVALEGIAKTFEAKVIAIAQKMEADANKKDMHIQSTIGRQLADVAKAVQGFEQQLQATKPNGKTKPGFTIENA